MIDFIMFFLAGSLTYSLLIDLLRHLRHQRRNR